MTSKKTIAVIAKAINDERLMHLPVKAEPNSFDAHFALFGVANKLADHFGSEDIAFNRAQFIRASGFAPKHDA